MSNKTRRQADDGAYLWLVLFTLVVVGGLVIALVYGTMALLTAVPILLCGAALIAVPWGVLTLIEKWRNRLQ